MSLPMRCGSAFGSPPAFVGWSRESIVPWLTGPCSWVPVQEEARSWTDKSRPFPSSAANRHQRAALQCLRELQPQARGQSLRWNHLRDQRPHREPLSWTTVASAPTAMSISERVQHRSIRPAGTVAIRGPSR